MEITNQKTQEIASNLFKQRQFDMQHKVDGLTICAEQIRSKTLLHSDVKELSLGPNRYLSLAPFVIGSSDRIGIRGPNGSGKTTLLHHLIASLGSSRKTSFVLDQDMDEQSSLQLYQAFLDLDEATKGRVVSCFTRLGSDPSLLLGSALPSPGELRKLLMAQSLERGVNALFLDEPTNHLDLPSRLALSEALASFTGTLVCVSHDKHFLSSICTTYFDIVWIDEKRNSQLVQN